MATGVKGWTPEARAKERESRRRYMERLRSDPERWARHCEQKRASAERYRQRHPERARASRAASTRKKTHGIDVATYNEMVKAQNGVCAICKQPPSGKRPLAIDHDHKTGRIRGLLCDGCNGGLGLFKDNPKALRAAIKYLEKSNAA